jgi:hypothetical protein
MDTSRVAKYVFEEKLHRSVAGWLADGAISAVIAFAKWQNENNILGDVAEIGVHHGKFFILLANLRRQRERAFAVDIFDDQHLNPDNSGRGNLARFTKNLQLYTNEADTVIIQKDSKTLTRADFYRSKRNSVRLFSVDGSHTAAYTFSDLTVAAHLLAMDGLIILDDFYNPDWPGVQEGFHRFLSDPATDVAPFAYGNNKLYLCKIASQAKYLGFVENDLRPFLLHHKRVEIGNFPVAHISLPAPELVFQPNLTHIPNVFPLRRWMISPGVTLRTGWAPLQSNGVWTVGPRAELNLKLESVFPEASALCMNIEPFLHRERASRRLSVTLNHHILGNFVFDKASPKSLEIPLPPGLLETDCDLEFDIEAPDRPSETIGSTDGRPLGFFLQQIRIVNREPTEPEDNGRWG